MDRSVHHDDVGRLVDLEDDPKVSAPRRAKAFELSAKSFTRSLRVLGDRSEDRLEHGRPDLLGKMVQVSKAFGGDLDLERQLPVVLEGETFPVCSFTSGPAERLEELRILEDLDGLLERLELVRAQQHGGRPSVAREDEPFMLADDLIDEL